MSVLTITKENFDELVIRAEKPVLIDFWASWCGPCRMMAPIVDEIAEEREDIVVGKINVDDEPEIATEYGIMSIPTLYLFKGGEIAEQIVGVRPKQQILDIIG